MKHLEVRQLWIQEKTASGQIAVTQVPQARNISDALTHHWSAEAAQHYGSIGLTRPHGNDTLGTLRVKLQRALAESKQF